MALNPLDGSFYKEVLQALSGKASSNHTHTSGQITDFDDAVDTRIQNIIGAAPSALDTLEEIAEALNNDPDFATTITTALADKVDKVTGKQLSTEDFTSPLLSKLNGIAENATANSADATLLNRSNHTGAQAISTVTGLQTALDGLATRITALETWRGLMKLARMEVFTTTTDGSGNFSVNTSASFTSPKVLATVVATAGEEGYHTHGASVSGTTVTGVVFKNKKQGVLLGGTIDPDEPASGVNVHVLVAQST